MPGSGLFSFARRLLSLSAAIAVSSGAAKVAATPIEIGPGFDGTGNIATAFVSASYGGAPPQNVLPASGSLLLGAGSATYAVADDFNGIVRRGTRDVGAYRYLAGGDPGWTLQAAFKKLVGIFADGFDGSPALAP